MGLRQLPGEGQFDLVRFLDVLESHGAMVPLTAEVVNHDLDALPPPDAARRMAESLRGLAARRARVAT
jgi:sugar phosphate isomerase/epimerase